MFPVIFLNTGQWENVLSAFQMCFVLSATLGLVAMFIVAATDDDGVTLRAAVGYGVCMFALPLFGGVGIGMTPALAVWALVVAVHEFRVGGSAHRRVAAVLTGSTLATIALVGGYFVGYERPEQHAPPPSDWSLRSEAIFKLAGMAFGPATRNYWPIVGGLMAVLLLGTCVAGGLQVLQVKTHRLRTMGFLAYFAAMVSLIFGIGLARVGRGVEHLYASRYMTICAPLVCATFFVWGELRWRRWARFVQMCLCGVSVFLLAGNIQEGESHGKNLLRERVPFVAELRSGVPLHTLARRHYKNLYPTEETLEERLRMLHDAGIGMFRELKVR
jgi:hypothetical protein